MNARQRREELASVLIGSLEKAEFFKRVLSNSQRRTNARLLLKTYLDLSQDDASELRPRAARFYFALAHPREIVELVRERTTDIEFLAAQLTNWPRFKAEWTAVAKLIGDSVEGASRLEMIAGNKKARRQTRSSKALKGESNG